MCHKNDAVNAKPPFFIMAKQKKKKTAKNNPQTSGHNRTRTLLEGDKKASEHLLTK